MVWIGSRKPVVGPRSQERTRQGHGHTRGTIDPIIATTPRGICARKSSFIVLAITSALKVIVVARSGGIALLADTIHNVGDTVTAIPRWIAFILAHRRSSKTFTYGLRSVEDLAGVAILPASFFILFSTILAGYETIHRLIRPQSLYLLGRGIVTGIIRFVNNEAVALFRIRVGCEIDSTSLITDGYHDRTDGFTSLAVVAGAIGVWLGCPLADPIVDHLLTSSISVSSGSHPKWSLSKCWAASSRRSSTKSGRLSRTSMGSSRFSATGRVG